MQKVKIQIILGIGCLLLLIGSLFRLWVPHPLFTQPYSTLLYSSETLLGARIATDGQWRFPPKQTVPERFAICLQQYEDKRFRYHPGVDVIAIARALYQNIQQKHIVSGGSTLTMQLARIARGNKERKIGRAHV